LDSNKGSFGRVTVVGGSEQYTGAPALVARAAGRAGAGLVALAMPRCVHAILATKLDEAIFAPQPDQDGAVALAAVAGLHTLAKASQAVALGPGLSRAGTAPETIRALLLALQADRGAAQLVIDADALNALSQQPEWWQEIPRGCVLTPHPGEMGRLCCTDAQSVQADRIGVARAAAARWQQCVLLKGAHTIIARPDGAWWLLPIANSALATAGTGDVLCGVIAGLLAQGMEPWTAAVCGAWAHGEAGLAAAQQYGAAGVLAGDLLPELPRALQRARGFAPPEG
jgi:NAD(P)H-hydrate epimerase